MHLNRRDTTHLALQNVPVNIARYEQLASKFKVPMRHLSVDAWTQKLAPCRTTIETLRVHIKQPPQNRLQVSTAGYNKLSLISEVRPDIAFTTVIPFIF